MKPISDEIRPLSPLSPPPSSSLTQLFPGTSASPLGSMPFPLKWGESEEGRKRKKEAEAGKREGGGREAAFHISSCKFSSSFPDYRRRKRIHQENGIVMASRWKME